VVSHVLGISEFRGCVIWEYVVCWDFHSSLILFGLFGHCLAIFPRIGIYGRLQFESLVCLIMPVRFVDDGGLASQYGQHR
jgi:hypothetical protein